jgi:hypothetical protein
MERLQQLIGKLNEQFEQKADPTQLLVTTQLIEKELLRLTSATSQVYSTSKVAVVMPNNGRSFTNNGNTVSAIEEVEVRSAYAKASADQSAYAPVPAGKPSYQPDESAVALAKAEETKETVKVEQKPWAFDPLREVPTLAQQAVVKELNEVIAATEHSLNDRLKEDVKEVAHLLTDAPVRDLRRAIGINDRFVFISELFRGDEVMYERSIKTINGFRIFPEAEYWIERELKVKLGWDETKDCTRHFYQLVKRRFS